MLLKMIYELRLRQSEKPYLSNHIHSTRVLKLMFIRLERKNSKYAVLDYLVAKCLVFNIDCDVLGKSMTVLENG